MVLCCLVLTTIPCTSYWVLTNHITQMRTQTQKWQAARWYCRDPPTAEQWPHQHGTTEGVTLQWQGANSDTVSPGVCSSYQQLLHCQFDRDYTTVRQPAVCGSTRPLTQLNKSFFITVIICCRIWDVTFSGLLRQSSLPKTVCTTRKKRHIFCRWSDILNPLQVNWAPPTWLNTASI